MNFKSYFSLNDQEKKLTSLNSGPHHHQSLNRMVGSGLNRKHANFVAKQETKKQHIHPKVTLCLNTKKDQKLTPTEAKGIMTDYGLYPTDDEPKKNIKQLGVCINKIGPDNYILQYRG